MRIIYCDSVVDLRTVDPDYEQELKSAMQAGFQVSLISFEALTEGKTEYSLKSVKQVPQEETAIYRGWMLTPEQYERLYQGLLSRNIRLINSPAEYRHCHYLPESYSIIAPETPKTIWTDRLDSEAFAKLKQTFGHKAIIVKDFVKSEKHHWETACYIPDAWDEQKVESVVKCFLELRGDALNEGLVFREFEALEYLIHHSKSGMPLAREYRLFFINHQLMDVIEYWEEGTYDSPDLPTAKFNEIAGKIQSQFFTMDIARKITGEWIIMELGDAQVAGLPDRMDSDRFYKQLSSHF